MSVQASDAGEREGLAALTEADERWVLEGEGRAGPHADQVHKRGRSQGDYRQLS